jgi:hypothetical protein
VTTPDAETPRVSRRHARRQRKPAIAALIPVALCMCWRGEATQTLGKAG